MLAELWVVYGSMAGGNRELELGGGQERTAGLNAAGPLPTGGLKWRAAFNQGFREGGGVTAKPHGG